MGKAPARGAAPEQEESSLRFRAAGFASHRKRLGLSAAQASKLLGVSSLSVYKWEAGKSHPRSSQLPAIARFRKLGKREAAALLEAAAA
jgi:DNA-binding transcriptional regulator YiaG